MQSTDGPSRPPGRLFVFEGPDGVGKSTIASAFTAHLAKTEPATLLSFPGREPGTLGALVYRVHHDSASVGIERLSPASLQALHVAAHLDAIETCILPRLGGGVSVILDRFWWSTWIYGVHAGVPRNVLDELIAAEKALWGSVVPSAVFLVQRAAPFRAETDTATWQALASAYRELAAREIVSVPVVDLWSDTHIEAIVERAVATGVRDPK